MLRVVALSVPLVLACSQSTGPGPVEVDSVEISPNGAQLFVGDTVRLQAQAKSASGAPLPGRAFQWSSNRDDVASIDSGGLVTAKTEGFATIGAATGGRSVSVQVEVMAVPAEPIDSVSVDPAAGTLEIGDTIRLTATTYAADGSVLTGRLVAFASDRVDVASVDQTGLVTAHAEGTAFVTATSEGQSATAEIQVEPAAPVALEITSLSPNQIQAGWSNFTMVVHGTGFVPQTRVLWEGVPLQTFYTNGTELNATVSASYVALEGSARVSVETPQPHPVTSNELVFTIHSRPALTVDITIPGNTVFVDGAVRLSAIARDQFGEVIVGKHIEWTSSDTTVAKIDGDLLRGLKAGSTNLVASATPTFTGKTFLVVAPPVQEVMFGASPTGTPELFVRSLDPTGSVRRFLPPVTYARQAAPSPDGTRVAFVGQDGSNNEDIYVADRDGSNVVRLTTAAGIDDQPAWSPDGLSIAFRSFRQGKSDVWVMDADGGNQRNLTYADAFVPEEYNDAPAWSPDSPTLVFSRGFGVSQSLYTIGADGTGLVEFLSLAGVDLLEPAWSPDGQRIAFRRHDRALQTDAIDFASSATGDLIYYLNGPPAGSRQPSWLTDEWMAVSAPVVPGSAQPTIAVVRLGWGNVVVPMGEEYGALDEPVVLPD